ncbi:MAG: tRNA lysidine(34) synthetase TilS [Ginsengibacter sp.]
MSLLNKFISFIQNQHLFSFNDRLIVAVSGGVDSVVLCELCKQAGFSFEMAHCNFQLRGEESTRDEIFVKSLGEKYAIKVFVKKFNTDAYASEHKVSIQVAARELRYEWFRDLIDIRDQVPGNFQNKSNPQHRTSHIVNPTFLLTAHHANDNIETLLMNFFKGTGISGLKGILPKKEKIIRPLLFAKKGELINFAAENKLSFVEDSSNTLDKYTRNYFRHQLIPSVQKVFPGVEENLLHNIERFREIEELYREIIAQYKNKLIEKKGNEIHIPVLKLLKTKALPTIVFEIIKDVGFTAHQVDEVVKLLASESGKYVSSTTHKIVKNRDWLIIAPHNTMEASTILISEIDEEIQFTGGKLTIKKKEADKTKMSTDNSVALLDATEITFPLLLRKWKQGDYFYPLGMKKKKKLSRFFTDQKISLSEKENTWVIESNKRIIWIVGRRIDDRFKLTGNTTRLLRFNYLVS